MSKQFLLILAIVIALLGGALVLTKEYNKANTDGAKTSTNG